MVDQNLLKQFNEWYNKMYPTTSMSSNSITQSAKPLVTKQGIKTVGKYLPLTGDVYDIVSGTKKIQEGHPFIGTGQAALGVGGLATLGLGSIAKSAGKGIVKGAIKKNIIDNALSKDMNKAINKGANAVKNVSDVLHNKWVAGSGIVLPEIMIALQNLYNKDNKENVSDNTTGVPYGQLQNGLEEVDPSDMGYDMSDIPKPGASSNQIAKANTIAKQIGELTQQNTQPITTDNKEEILKQYIAMLEDRNAPYIKALNSYLSKYPRLLNQSGRNDLYFYGANLAKGLDPRAGEKFNQVKNYENMVGIVKAIQDARNAGVDYANEVAGNMDVAQTLGLSPQAAYANKNLLSAYSMGERDKVRQAIANANYLTKIYGIDSRAALQLTLQQMKNENAANVARIYMGLTDNVPAVGLTQTGQPQQTQKTQTRSADPRQQFFD